MRRAAFLSLALAACGSKQEPLGSFNEVPHFTLTAQSGSEFSSQAELAGHVWIANFIFTTCTGPCPRMTSQMRQIQDALAGLPEVRFVSFTVDPANDTPAALAAYARRHNADARRWFFLTGAQQDLHKLNREAFLLGNTDGSMDHSTRFVLIDTTRRVRKYYDSTEPGFLAEILADVKSL